MTGDAPQPGDKPRAESDPWSDSDANIAWWRTDGDGAADDYREITGELAEAGSRPRRRRRPAPTTPANATVPRAVGEPAFAPEALDAHAAGAQDATQALNPPAAQVEVEDADEAPADGADPVHDVMVLPEPAPNRNRPTVVLDRGAVPGQPAGGSRPAPAAMDPVRAERLENSPFWLSEEERAAAGNTWPTAQTGQRLAEAPGAVDTRRGKPPLHMPRAPRRPATGLAGLVALALVAAFFGWVSAEPFWLAVGHGDRGVATVARCTGDGMTQRCVGTFAAADGRFTVERVTLLGVEPAGRTAGAATPARMVSADSRQAYVGTTGPLLHLRWVLGFLLVLLCGYGIAGLTGARRLETARARRTAVLTSLAGPLVLLAGFLAAAY